MPGHVPDSDPVVLIGDRVLIGRGSGIVGHRSVVIGDGVFTGHNVYVTDANHYDSSFAKWNSENGGAADNVYIRMGFVPFEEADKSPATKKYLDLVAKSGGKTGLLGTQAAANFLLWATGVKACGSAVTDTCVIGEIAKLSDWTAGGLHVPMQPAKNEAANCGMLVKLTGARFERVAPIDKTFDCDPKFQATNLRTEYVTAAKLDANRVATQFGSFTP